nr:YbaB/EbfC family nucleoid-associated protein [Kibdelosporangium phytohabitans]
MRDFESKIADAQAKAAAVQQGLANAEGSASSKDGTVTVTVAPTGALTNLRLTAEAMRLSHSQLAAEIMAVARTAQRSAATQVAETFEQVNGAGSESYQLIAEYLPPAEEQDEEELEPRQYGFEDGSDNAEQPPAPPRPEPPRRPAARPDETDDPEFGNGSIFRG